MTVEERLLFIRAGYSAQDIANFEKADEFAGQKPVEPKTKPVEPKTKPVEPETKPVEPETKPAEPETKPVEPKPDKEPMWAKALAEGIKTLTAATQAANRRFDDMGEPEQAVDKALDALKEIYGGKTK